MEFVKIVTSKHLQQEDGGDGAATEISGLSLTPGVVDCERCSLQLASFALEANSTAKNLAVIESGLILNKSLSLDESISFPKSAPAWLRRSLGSLLGLLAGLFLTVGCLLNSSVRSMGVMQSCSARSLFAALFLAPPLIIFKPAFRYVYDNGLS